MATANCSTVAEGGGKDICQLLEGVGEGLGSMLDVISSPLAVWILVLGVAGGVGAIVVALASRVSSNSAGAPRTGRRSRSKR